MLHRKNIYIRLIFSSGFHSNGRFRHIALGPAQQLRPAQYDTGDPIISRTQDIPVVGKQCCDSIMRFKKAQGFPVFINDRLSRIIAAGDDKGKGHIRQSIKTHGRKHDANLVRNICYVIRNQ